MKEKRKLLFSMMAMLLLILATVGVTFAVFTYTKLGTTENTVTTGTLKFLYTENTGVGNGINIENAFPVSDEVGKGYNTDKYVFNFSVEATNSGTEEIPYEVTLRKKNTSTLLESNVKIYLTDMTEDSDTAIVGPILYSDLVQTTIDVGEETEKTIYNGTVLGGELTYKKDFRLRMWIDEGSNYDSIAGKTFTALVNVYSNVPLISEEEIDSRNNTEISTLSVGDSIVTPVTGKDYDYVMSVDEGTTSITINPETDNPNATVTVEKVDSLVYKENNVTRLSTAKTFDLAVGNNYFKITVRSENKQFTDEYILKVRNGLSGFARKIYESNTLITAEPTLTDSSNNTSDASGLYKSTATNDGSPTYYFRGNVENNYVDFAGYTWRIVRINEDGTVRLILDDVAMTDTKFVSSTNGYNSLYYSYAGGMGIPYNIAMWAQFKLANWNKDGRNYRNYVSSGNYFCEQAKVTYLDGDSSISAGNVTMAYYGNYTPTFKCETDANGYGMLNNSIGLLSYDEVVFAGGYYNKSNSNYYLNDGSTDIWTSSPAGVHTNGGPLIWGLYADGKLSTRPVGYAAGVKTVIILKEDITVTGTGEADNHYVVQ